MFGHKDQERQERFGAQPPASPVLHAKNNPNCDPRLVSMVTDPIGFGSVIVKKWLFIGCGIVLKP